MALIIEFRHAPHASPAWKSETTCGYRIAKVDGRQVLHLETYGSSARAVPGKGSQYFTLDEAAAASLQVLLHEAFPSLAERHHAP